MNHLYFHVFQFSVARIEQMASGSERQEDRQYVEEDAYAFNPKVKLLALVHVDGVTAVCRFPC